MVTEAEWDEAQARTARLRVWSAIGGLVVLGLLVIPSAALGGLAGSGWTAWLATSGCVIALLAPGRCGSSG